MKLKQLFLHRLPGFKHRGFNLNDLSERINIIVGPNASGKTSICQAIEKLLWSDKNKGFVPCSIDSVWEEGGTSFTIGLEDGIRSVSQAGLEAMQSIPHESMASCYSLKIDDLFDSKDEVFASKIAQEISGGYDIEAAEKKLMVVPNARSAVKDWKEAKEKFEEYKRGQKDLEREKEELPFLEEAIKEAKEAETRLSELKKQLEVKSLPFKRHPELEIFAPWVAVNVSEETFVEEEERILRMQRLYQDRVSRLSPQIKALEAAILHHTHLFGIQDEQVFDQISAKNLETVEEAWETLEGIKSKIIGLKEQVSLYEGAIDLEAVEREIALLLKLKTFPDIPLWLRWTLLLPLWPWIYFKVDLPKKKLEALVQNKDLTGLIEKLGRMKTEERMKKGLESKLKAEYQTLETCRRELFEKGKQIGLHLFPTESRYRFASLVKRVYEDWVHLKMARQELAENHKQLEMEWVLWKRFAVLFGEEGVDEIYDLEGCYKRIKRKKEGASALKEERLKVEAHEKRLQDIVLSVEELTLSIEQEEKKVSELVSLSEKRAVLKSELTRKEASHEGQKLLKEQEAELQRVKEAARAFAENACLTLLLQRTQAAFKKDSEPRVLQMASLWFSRFTKNAFLLEISRGSLVYEALQTATHERKSLEQLSRGTRIQLLLAVRLSFATHKLPILMDEVLANTDPERFDAIVDVLKELLNEGRQVFYFSCNPEEAYRWKERDHEAHLIDLALIQKNQAFLAAPFPITLRNEIPKPATTSLESYAQELKVPAFSLKEPLELTSSYYLVERSETLYRLHLSGLTTYGQIKALKPGYLEKALPNEAHLIKKRGELLEAFYALKKQGRGVPLVRSLLEQSSLSKKRLEAVWELAEACELDGQKFMQALEARDDPRTKGLHQKTTQELREMLVNQGYLDERPVLSDDVVRQELFPLIEGEADHLFVEKLIGSS